MRLKILLLLFVSISLQSKAQNTGVATYTFKSYGDYDTEAKLFFKDGKYWYSRHQEPRKFTSSSPERYEIYHYKDYFDWFYSSINDSVLIILNKYKYPPLYSKWKKNIEWDIKEETRELNGFKVQKAIAKPFKKDSEYNTYGNVIAWFTTEIPVQAGPEGYYGLPGLIVRLEYSGMDVFQCDLQGVEFKEVDITMPAKEGTVEVSKKEIYNTHHINKKWLRKQNKLLKKQKKLLDSRE